MFPGQSKRFCQTEISHLDPSVGIEEAVARLDIAVDDAAAVRLLQTLDDIEDLGNRLAHGQRPLLLDEVVEGAARASSSHDVDVRPAGLLVGGEDEDASGMPPEWCLRHNGGPHGES